LTDWVVIWSDKPSI